MSKYTPLGREFEMQMRRECPEYVASRNNEADGWRHVRKVFGRAEARRSWRAMLNARRLAVRMINDRLYYSSSLPATGLNKSFSEFWDAN